MSLSAEINVSFQSDEPTGDLCTGCGDIIKGTRWVMMIQVGDPLINPPEVMDVVYCTLCKLEFEKSE